MSDPFIINLNDTVPRRTPTEPLIWELKHPRATFEMLGPFLPTFLDGADPRPAAEQYNESYAHGGGWQPFESFRQTSHGLEYPGDPTMLLIAETHLRDETIRLYDCAWVTITQPDGSFEACRMD